MRRIAAAGISAMLLVSACGSDDSADTDASPDLESPASDASSDDSVSPETQATDALDAEEQEEESAETGADVQDIEADQAAAEAALLMLSDFPPGWSEVPDTQEDDEELSRRQVECLGGSGTELIDTEARAETGQFTDPDDGSQVEEVVGLTASVDDATATLSGFSGDDVTLCLTELYNDRYRAVIEESVELGEAELGDITVGVLNITPVGDESYAFRIQIPISLGALTFSPTADLVAVRVGRSLAGLNFFSEDGATPIERIEEYTGMAASRLLSATSGGEAAETEAPVETEAPPAVEAPVETEASAETIAPVDSTDYTLTDEEPPPFVLLGVDPQYIKGYVMPNGRILWVDETSGIGRIIANPDEVLADQATCEYLFGMDTADWFDWAAGIPNFEGPVCHPYSVNEDL